MSRRFRRRGDGSSGRDRVQDVIPGAEGMSDADLAASLQEMEDRNAAMRMEYSQPVYAERKSMPWRARSLGRMLRMRPANYETPQEMLEARMAMHQSDSAPSPGGDRGAQSAYSMPDLLVAIAANTEAVNRYTEGLLNGVSYDQTIISPGSPAEPEVPPATSAEIEELPVFTFRGNTQAQTTTNNANDKEDAATVDENDVRCQICLEDFEEGEDLRAMPCLHKFHAHCVARWLLQKKNCPLCKQVISSG